VKTANAMTYEEFKAEYARLFHIYSRYAPDQVGFQIYSGKLADLVDAYPEHELRFDIEEDTP